MIQKDNRVRVTVLTGFLGAGKTTLLNRFLKQSAKRFAIVENEFGAASIDHHLIERSQELVIEVRNGCLCCKVRGDLIDALQALELQRENFDEIMIETTGLADPEPILQTFSSHPFVRQHFKLNGIVSLVDCKNAGKNWAAAVEIRAQIANADIIILTKADIASEQEKSDCLEKILLTNPTALLFDACNDLQAATVAMGNVDVLRSKWRYVASPVSRVSKQHLHSSVHAEVIEVERPFSFRHLNAFLNLFFATWGSEIYRLKGIFWSQDHGNPYLLQAVQHEFETTELNSKDYSNRKSQLVLIAKSNLMSQLLHDGLRLCSEVQGQTEVVQSVDRSVENDIQLEGAYS